MDGDFVVFAGLSDLPSSCTEFPKMQDSAVILHSVKWLRTSSWRLGRIFDKKASLT